MLDLQLESFQLHFFYFQWGIALLLVAIYILPILNYRYLYRWYKYLVGIYLTTIIFKMPNLHTQALKYSCMRQATTESLSLSNGTFFQHCITYLSVISISISIKFIKILFSQSNPVTDLVSLVLENRGRNNAWHTSRPPPII